MNEDSIDDFVAVDFELCTPIRTSAISLGMVKVIDAEIVQKFYAVINPVRDEYTDREPNRNIHGISLETAEKAPTFEEIFKCVKLFIDDYPLVCHNRSVDITVFRELMDYYGLKGIKLDNSICTLERTRMSLEKCCEEFGIKMETHHNALNDAEACARIYLELINKPLINVGGGSIFGKGNASTRKVSTKYRKRLDADAVKNKNTIFFGAKVVITGVFDEYPDRDELASKLQALGAKVSASISKSTDYLLVGENAGPKKIEKVKELQAAGLPIKILRERKIVSIVG